MARTYESSLDLNGRLGTSLALLFDAWSRSPNALRPQTSTDLIALADHALDRPEIHAIAPQTQTARGRATRLGHVLNAVAQTRRACGRYTVERVGRRFVLAGYRDLGSRGHDLESPEDSGLADRP